MAISWWNFCLRHADLLTNLEPDGVSFLTPTACYIKYIPSLGGCTPVQTYQTTAGRLQSKLTAFYRRDTPTGMMLPQLEMGVH